MLASFLTIFVSVFLAELGDKTQLATALFAGEGDRPKWLVFLASSTALVTSTALATLAGSLLHGLFNGPWLKLAAGVSFIVIGAFIVWEALRPA
jgi:putative Ca2+/H+ antiporter (TMEM165/GDT1 family)